MWMDTLVSVACIAGAAILHVVDGRPVLLAVRFIELCFLPFTACERIIC